MKALKVAAVALLLSSPLALAQTKVAVLDSMAVVSQSNMGKEYIAKAEASLKPQATALQKMESEIRSLQQKLQKDGPTLSEDKLRARQQAIQVKAEEFQLKGRQFQQAQAESQNGLLEKVGPKVQPAIDAVVKAQEIDVVIQRQAAVYASPSVDITNLVIEQLNKAK